MSEHVRDLGELGLYADTLRKEVANSVLEGAQKARALRRLALIAPEQAERWAALSGADPDHGMRFLARALRIAPGDYRLHVNRANRWLRSGAVERCNLSLRRAALLQPGLARVYKTLGAITSLRERNLRLLSQHWVAGGTLDGAVAMAERLMGAERVSEALRLVEFVLANSPLEANAWRIRALLLQMRRDAEGSQQSHFRSLICNPASDTAYLAATAFFLECSAYRVTRSLLSCARVLAPESLAVRINLGALYEREGRPESALNVARQVLLLQPHSAERYFTCSSRMYDCGRFAEAGALQQRCSLIAPKDRRFHNNAAILALKAGDYQAGLKLYEDRFYAPKPPSMRERTLKPPKSFDLPLWEPGAGGRQRVLLWAEQGLGDEIWGLSYLTALAGREEEFAVECDERLIPLLRRTFPAIRTFPRRPEPDFDWTAFDRQMPLLSLPYRLGLANMPSPGGWLRLDPDGVSSIRRRFAGEPGARIAGIAWKSIKPLPHRSFSIELERFAGLADVPDLRVLPLQYDMTDRERDALVDMFGRDRLVLPDFDVRDDLVALATAIAGSDLLVTIAAALVPLAGAVGTSSIVLLRNVQQDWRYGYSGVSSPWLPGAILLRPPASESGQEIGDALTAALS